MRLFVSLHIAQEAPQTNFIACVSPLKASSSAGHNGMPPEFGGPLQRMPKSKQIEQEGAAPHWRDAYEFMTDPLRHKPQVPPRITALLATEVKMVRGRSGAVHGFDAVHVWKQLHDLQILVRRHLLCVAAKQHIRTFWCLLLLAKSHPVKMARIKV